MLLPFSRRLPSPTIGWNLRRIFMSFMTAVELKSPPGLVSGRAAVARPKSAESYVRYDSPKGPVMTAFAVPACLDCRELNMWMTLGGGEDKCQLFPQPKSRSRWIAH
jgi:hypothetical protein